MIKKLLKLVFLLAQLVVNFIVATNIINWIAPKLRNMVNRFIYGKRYDRMKKLEDEINELEVKMQQTQKLLDEYEEQVKKEKSSGASTEEEAEK